MISFNFDLCITPFNEIFSYSSRSEIDIISLDIWIFIFSFDNKNAMIDKILFRPRRIEIYTHQSYIDFNYSMTSLRYLFHTDLYLAFLSISRKQTVRE